MTPSEAAKHRWKQNRARQTAGSRADPEDEDGGEVVFVRVAVRTSEIIRRLEQDARNGDTRAARELRAWLAEVQVERHTDVADLDAQIRQRLLARLLAEIEQEDRDQLD